MGCEGSQYIPPATYGLDVKRGQRGRESCVCYLQRAVDLEEDDTLHGREAEEEEAAVLAQRHGVHARAVRLQLLDALQPSRHAMEYKDEFRFHESTNLRRFGFQGQKLTRLESGS